MKNAILTAALTMLIASAPSAALAAEGHAGHAGRQTPGAAANEAVKDPVCGMKISPKDAKKTTVFKGKKHYFCMDECYGKFKADPAKYVK